jgi:hypothetical protein
MPDAGWIMALTRTINLALGTAYSLEDVAELNEDPAFYALFRAVKKGLWDMPAPKKR